MKIKIWFLGIWEDLRSSFWFLPTLMALGSVAASELTLWIDGHPGVSDLHFAMFYTGGADGARSVLSTIASSMIGVGGVVFSMTLVTLSLAAQQFGSRTLRSLVRDRANQVVLGVFISAFLFCLMVLRQIRNGADGGSPFVPEISMLGALVFALGGLSMLIYFIHHISFVIQAPNVIAAAGEDLLASVRENAPGNWVQHYDSNALKTLQNGNQAFVRSCASGYVRRVDYESLASLANDANVVLIVEKRPGDFVMIGEAILNICFESPPARKKSASLETKCNAAFGLGSQRTQEQDLRFLIGQLLSIALLALSPAVNNPIQAILCIDRLADALKAFALNPKRGDYLLGDSKVLALIDRGLCFEELFVLSFREIRRNSKTQLMVSLALLDTYQRLHSLIDDAEARLAIEAEYVKLRLQTATAFAEDFKITTALPQNPNLPAQSVLMRTVELQ
jgi:uncharacterized membrane protein